MIFEKLEPYTIFINLQKRTDRRKEIEQELKHLTKDYTRLEASEEKNPKLRFNGCTHSHIRALQKGYESQKPFVCILEDDFLVHNPKQSVHFQEKIENFWRIFQREANVLMLSVNPRMVKKSCMNGVVHIIHGLSSAGYLIRRNYIPVLIKNLKESIRKKVPLDMNWQKLQRDGSWFALQPPLGRQRPGYSDIEGAYRDYRASEQRYQKF